MEDGKGGVGGGGGGTIRGGRCEDVEKGMRGEE